MRHWENRLSPSQWRDLAVWNIACGGLNVCIQMVLLALLDAPRTPRESLGAALSGAVVVQIYLTYLKLQKLAAT